ncbi:hypothetical protein [Neisseria iguanae]|nr:hypothetical protein [Neisseria iguanae]
MLPYLISLSISGHQTQSRLNRTFYPKRHPDGFVCQARYCLPTMLLAHKNR